MSLRTRLAPTPSGYLHFGNALSFVLTWAIARTQKGWILLRIDDLDQARRRPEYLEDIFRTIDWLGIDYDEGPSGPDDFLATYTQQLRLSKYHQVIDRLKEMGQLYACTCSRKDIRLQSQDGNYPGTCRDKQLNFDAPRTAWRVKVFQNQEIAIPDWKGPNGSLDLAKEMGDFVILQKNGAPAYQIASLVDDERWRINFIVRGADLRPSTAAQLLLAQLLDYQTFIQASFWHHGLITGSDGRKLSKSEGADALKSRREAGEDPSSIVKMAAEWLGMGAKNIGTSGELLAALRELQ